MKPLNLTAPWVVYTIISLIVVVLVAGSVVLLLSLRGPTLSEVGSAKGFGGPDPHLFVEVSDLCVDESGDLWVTTRLRNTGGENLMLSTEVLGFVVVDEVGGARAPRDLGGPLPQLRGGEEVTRVVQFERPSPAANSTLWIYVEDILTRLLPLGRRNVLTPKLVLPLADAWHERDCR